MQSHLMFRPDLFDAFLEERILPAYSPLVPPSILTAGGFIVVGTPPGLSSALNSAGGGPGGSGGSGGNVSTAFSITGFGLSSITIGNSTGLSALNPRGAGSTSGPGGLSLSVGSGANDASGPQIVSRNTLAQGGPSNIGADFLYIGKEFGAGGVAPLEATHTNQPTTAPGANGPAPAPAPAPTPPPQPTAPTTPPTGLPNPANGGVVTTGLNASTPVGSAARP